MLALAAVLLTPLSAGSVNPACPPCALEAARVATLGADHPLALADPSFLFLRDSRGRYLVGDGRYVSQLLEFAATGRFVAVRGRPGDQPGEFRGLRALYRWRGDSILAFDRTLGRLHVLSPDLRVARSIPFDEASVGDPALLDDGRLLAWELGPAGSRTRLLSVDGGTGRTVDSARATFGAAPRLFAPAFGGGFWTGRMDRYVFRLHRADGSIDRMIAREAAWMVGAGGPVGLPTSVRPNPRVVALQDDGDRLWVWGLVAAADWAPARSGDDGDDAPLPSATALFPLFDTVVEVLDRWTGALLASTRLRGAHLATAEPGWATRAVKTGAGRSVIEVVRVSLR